MPENPARDWQRAERGWPDGPWAPALSLVLHAAVLAAIFASLPAARAPPEPVAVVAVGIVADSGPPASAAGPSAAPMPVPAAAAAAVPASQPVAEAVPATPAVAVPASQPVAEAVPATATVALPAAPPVAEAVPQPTMRRKPVRPRPPPRRVPPVPAPAQLPEAPLTAAAPPPVPAKAPAADAPSASPAEGSLPGSSVEPPAGPVAGNGSQRSGSGSGSGEERPGGGGRDPVDAYLAAVRQRIQQTLVYPPAARRLGLAGLVRLRFAIASDGRVGLDTLRVVGGTDLSLRRTARRRPSARSPPFPRRRTAPSVSRCRSCFRFTRNEECPFGGAVPGRPGRTPPRKEGGNSAAIFAPEMVGAVGIEPTTPPV